MKQLVPPLLLLGVLLFALFHKEHNRVADQKQNIHTIEKTTMQRVDISHIEKELQALHTDAYTKAYIVHVINHGSRQLHFKEMEVMEGGFISKEDAPKVACYILSLSGKACKTPYPKEAVMFYTSVCGGCHGNDGKGVGGSYPDLTRKRLLGIEKREAYLKTLRAKTSPLLSP